MERIKYIHLIVVFSYLESSKHHAISARVEAHSVRPQLWASTVSTRPLVSGNNHIQAPARSEKKPPSTRPLLKPYVFDSTATSGGVTNCVARARLSSVLSAVVRMRVGYSSENMGPKLDHVPVPMPVNTIK